jgi:hypothetical protein
MAYVDADKLMDPDRNPEITQLGSTPTQPWSGAPANNPTAAPEQGYWGSFTGATNHEYTPEQQKFDSFFKDYWAPDRGQVLSDLRFKPPTFSGTAQQQPSQQAPQQQAPQSWDMNTFSQRFGTPRTPQELIAMEGQLGQAGIKVLRNSAGVAGKIQLPNGQVVDVITAAGAGGRGFQWLTGEGGGGPDPRMAGSTFDDPATTQWEQLLRQLVERMNQPQPTWSNSQMDLMQTQALDPLERQRQARKQQETQRLAARNIQPESGIWREAMSNIDRQFDQARTQTQAGFATQAIGREDQLFANNEQRALNSVNLFKQIPQYADTRMQLANSMLMAANPYQTLSLNNQYQGMAMQNQQYQNAQHQQFNALIASLLYDYFNSNTNG